MTEQMIILKAFTECLVKATAQCGEVFWGPKSNYGIVEPEPSPDPVMPFFTAIISQKISHEFGDNRIPWTVYVSYKFELRGFNTLIWRGRIVRPDKDLNDDMVKWLCETVKILHHERTLADPEYADFIANPDNWETPA